MYNEATLDPERCTHKSDEKARRKWLITYLCHIDQYEDINNPTGDQHKDDIMEEKEADPGHPTRTEMPPRGSKAHAHIGGTSATATATCTTITGVPHPPVVTHLRFDTPEPPTTPTKTRGGTEPDNRKNVEHQNMFAPLRQHGSETGDHITEALSSRIYSVAGQRRRP